jgi:hypothetical protein
MLPEPHEMIGRRLIIGMMTIIPTSAAPSKENCISQSMERCEFGLISRRP